jgi:hypothetical protein
VAPCRSTNTNPSLSPTPSHAAPSRDCALTMALMSASLRKCYWVAARQRGGEVAGIRLQGDAETERGVMRVAPGAGGCWRRRRCLARRSRRCSLARRWRRPRAAWRRWTTLDCSDARRCVSRCMTVATKNGLRWCMTAGCKSLVHG